MEQTRTVTVIPAKKTVETPRVAGRKKRLRVAAYCRVSTDSEEQLNSYEAQKTYYTELIQGNKDWEMAGIFADEGLSGTSTKKRAEFNRMIAACKRGRIDLILTKSLSRFARNTVDCLEIVRTLKALGIGVIFEKENINTLNETGEFMITVFSSFAQAESESISKNVTWGIQKSMRAGNAAFQYKKLLGYRKGPDGEPEIDPDEAEVVRRIYRRYLEGASLGDIKRELEADGIPTAMGSAQWSYQTIHNILRSEKYIGDVLLQKTYTTDCISKTKKQNNGEREMYYIENHHKPIIPKEVYKRVQEELARRASKKKVQPNTAETEQSKYCGKYALSELLVCGECGSPYKRCTWARKGRKRIVWRCASRLEFGKEFCHESPTMDEERIQNAVVKGLNQFASDQTEITESALSLAYKAMGGGTADEMSLSDLRRRLEELSAEQSDLLDKVLEDMDNPELNARLKEASDEKQTVLERIKALEQAEERNTKRAGRQAELRKWAKRKNPQVKKYDETMVRKMVEKITVIDCETVSIRIRDTGDDITVCLNTEG